MRKHRRAWRGVCAGCLTAPGLRPAAFPAPAPALSHSLPGSASSLNSVGRGPLGWRSTNPCSGRLPGNPSSGTQELHAGQNCSLLPENMPARKEQAAHMTLVQGERFCQVWEGADM